MDSCCGPSGLAPWAVALAVFLVILILLFVMFLGCC